jgi:hypothetical protein
VQFKVEYDTYPYLKDRFEKQGYMTQRIEGNTSVPDMFICKQDRWCWVEVKMYRGSKMPNYSNFSANDLSWKPGQLRFRNDMIKKGCKRNYLLVVCKEDIFYFIPGGLDRC